MTEYNAKNFAHLPNALKARITMLREFSKEWNPHRDEAEVNACYSAQAAKEIMDKDARLKGFESKHYKFIKARVLGEDAKGDIDISFLNCMYVNLKENNVENIMTFRTHDGLIRPKENMTELFAKYTAKYGALKQEGASQLTLGAEFDSPKETPVATKPQELPKKPSFRDQYPFAPRYRGQSKGGYSPFD